MCFWIRQTWKIDMPFSFDARDLPVHILCIALLLLARLRPLSSPEYSVKLKFLC